MKIKELKKANEELQYQIALITQQQRQLEQEVLLSTNQETLTLAKMKAMADVQRVLEQQYREMSCRSATLTRDYREGGGAPFDASPSAHTPSGIMADEDPQARLAAVEALRTFQDMADAD